MAFSAIASVASGIMGASSAKKAAAAQERAAQQDLAFQRETRDLILERMDPFYQPGITAQNALSFELGLGARPMVGGTAPQIETFTETMSMGQPAGGGVRSVPGVPANMLYPGRNGEERRRADEARAAAQPQSVTRYRVGGNVFNTLEEAQAWARANPQGGTEYQGFQATPGYQFQMDQGTAAVNALAGARGGLDSGRTRQDLLTFGQGLANQEYNTYVDRLTNMAGVGYNAAAAQGTAATNAASGVSNALAGIGNAQSAGAIGQGQAWQDMFGNLAGLNQYQRNVTGQNAPGMNFGNANWARGMTGNQLLPPRF